MHDHRGQPTSTALMRACVALDIQPALTSCSNPKGKADTERCMRTLKEEYLWQQDRPDPLELIRPGKDWLTHQKGHDFHSALGHLPP